MKSRWSGIFVMSTIAVMMSILVAGCNDAPEQVEAPEPETVVVTSEKTVEVPVTVERNLYENVKP